MQIFPLPGLPEIRRGQDLAALIYRQSRRSRFAFADCDVLIVAQKIVSKAEGRVVSLHGLKPSADALRLSRELRQDSRFLEAVLRETRRIVRRGPQTLIVETHHGLVCASAGVDRSNVPGKDRVALLPRNPDASARKIAARLRKLTGKRLAVVISDTFGRPWRLGLTNVAIGAAGLPVLLDLRGSRDRAGKRLHATILALADDLAAAAGLLMGKGDGIPVVVIRGLRYPASRDSAARIIRPASQDLFR
ncbi:MAG TPA: coenzyme F420-0:L-glutamate ligase [Methylomirabilota bacterium]|nr:coenzyme F420-0:L-glutamate ligase [Methylomirabilota bacterium]